MSQEFLPKDREGALHQLKALLYRRAFAREAKAGDMAVDDPARDEVCDEVRFLFDLVDMLERS